MDIGYGKVLDQAIMSNDKRHDLRNWQSALEQLVERGKISEDTKHLYEEG